ncbi:MAG: hypothetical protein LBL13_07210 [Bacteroidales bacterium]|jgi:hypothetical protein|nr:hypothetical protein [Bacteroidales bacterium]
MLRRQISDTKKRIDRVKFLSDSVKKHNTLRLFLPTLCGRKIRYVCFFSRYLAGKDMGKEIKINK